MEALEVHEKVEHAAGGAHGGGHGAPNREVGLLIAALAAALALAEAAGGGAQTEALDRNVEASNLWAFYQAKTIRMTIVRTAAEAARLRPGAADPASGPGEQLDAWERTAARYESEPGTGEGREELAARAGTAEAARARALAAYHLYEYGSAAFQLAIVLASATVITGVAALALAAGGLGVVGIGLCLLGWLAPAALHL
jgi:hypothetical protein